MGWYVDGEWKVENTMLTFLQFKDRSGLATNNLVMKSVRIEFIWDFILDHRPPATPIAAPRIKEKEVLAWSVSPEIYDIKTFDGNLTTMHVNGIVLFVFRGPDGKGVVKVKQFPTPTMYDAREIHTEPVTLDKVNACQIDYINKRVNFNVTMEFEQATLILTVNDVICLEHKIPEAIFPTHRATTSFFGYSTENDPVCIRFQEISIYKEVNMMVPSEGAFTGSVHGLIQMVRKLDPEHFRNASLSNIMLMDVGLQGKTGQGAGETPGSNGTHRHPVIQFSGQHQQLHPSIHQ